MRGPHGKVRMQAANLIDREAAADWGGVTCASHKSGRQSGRRSIGANAMRSVLASVLALGLLVTLCASANAAKVHRPLHPRVRPHVFVPVPAPGVTAPRLAVPGWSDGATERWLDNASSGWSQA
jgi:hypothetical protein